VTRAWWSAADLVKQALPGMPSTERGVALQAERRGWLAPEHEGFRWRPRAGRGGGVEFHTSVLPLEAQAKLAITSRTERASGGLQGHGSAELHAADMWAWFDRQPDKKKTVARERLQILDAIDTLISNAVGKTEAINTVARLRGTSSNTIRNWIDAIPAVAGRADRLPYLCPRHAGQQPQVECPPEAWSALMGDWLRQTRPNFSDCYRRLQRMAEDKGWTLPSERTLLRRVMAIPLAQRVLLRDGVDALRRMFPAQRRDRSVFHALEGVNADGHTWDVFVMFPGMDKPSRPNMVAVQDLYSGKILAWRVDQSLSWHLVRLAFGDVVETYGIPKVCYLDNGREFASKMITGGQPTRYRFKVRDEEPEGLLTAIGVQVHWTTPYHGQAKPIERAFRDMAQSIAKHPAFEGAYTGNSPTNKPDNYGSKAVPFDLFMKVVGEGIAEHNARLGRKSPTCHGRSFDATFAESYQQNCVTNITKASPEQRRLWLLAADTVRVRKQDGQIHFYENRYWSQFLNDHMGSSVTVRFDPMALGEPLHVYALDGRYLGEAAAQEVAGFNSVADAQAQARLWRDYLRSTRAGAAALERMSLTELVRNQAKIDAAEPPPAPRVVRLIHGNTVLQPVPVEEAEDAPDRITEALRKYRLARETGQPAFYVVPEPNDAADA